MMNFFMAKGITSGLGTTLLRCQIIRTSKLRCQVNANLLYYKNYPMVYSVRFPLTMIFTYMTCKPAHNQLWPFARKAGCPLYKVKHLNTVYIISTENLYAWKIYKYYYPLFSSLVKLQVQLLAEWLHLKAVKLLGRWLAQYSCYLCCPKNQMAIIITCSEITGNP